MKRLLAKSIALLVVAGLAACQHRQTISYPRLADAGTAEAGLDCVAVDDDILKTDAVRWVMRQDGARLLSPEAKLARGAANVATTAAVAVGCINCPDLWLRNEGDAALDRADRRLLSLLRIKQAKRCAARPTAVAELTDLQLGDAVSRLVAQESQPHPGTSTGSLRAERMRLLDQLRP